MGSEITIYVQTYDVLSLTRATQAPHRSSVIEIGAASWKCCSLAQSGVPRPAFGDPDLPVSATRQYRIHLRSGQSCNPFEANFHGEFLTACQRARKKPRMVKAV